MFVEISASEPAHDLATHKPPPPHARTHASHAPNDPPMPLTPPQARHATMSCSSAAEQALQLRKQAAAWNPLSTA
eukprot:6214357-Pleurochrysis_carterae.AAC.5